MKMLAKIETLRRFVLMTVLAAMSMFVVSCSSSDDDDPAPAYGDFYIDLKSATIIQYTIKGRFMSR